MKRNNYVLGLDIGVTSVGYGVIDPDAKKAITWGVRLFDENSVDGNLKRREKRSSRRIKRRRQVRIEDAKKLLLKEGLLKEGESVTKFNNIYAIRVKGLHEKLTNGELCAAIIHLIKQRGSGIETVEENEEKLSESLKSKEILKKNELEIKQGKYVCEIQLSRLQEQGKIRGSENNFKTKHYENELRKILSNQDVSTSFTDNIISLLNRRREYWMGPGSTYFDEFGKIKSISPFGRFTSFDQKEPIDLIDKMRGKCSIYIDEPRAPKKSFTAEYFNFLNDINNLTVNGEKISYEDKQSIKDELLKKGNLTPKQLAKLLAVDLLEIQGFRIDKNGKPLLTELSGYKIIKKILSDSELYQDLDLVDDITEILSKTKSIEERQKLLLERCSKFKQNELEELSILNKISGFHSLSFKALKEIIREMEITSNNQMQIITINGLNNKNYNSLKGKKEILSDEEAILSPVAKRAQREAMKVVNALRNTYGEFNSIVIETTRAKNSAEEKKDIENRQKEFEKSNKDAEKLILEAYPNIKINQNLLLKVKLYLEQNCKTMYSCKSIDLKQLINDPTAFEIEHIAPISISFDDSLQNKALDFADVNRRKDNLTPLAAFNSGKLSGYSKEAYLENVDAITKNNPKLRQKRKYLLLESIDKFSDIKGFIARNLVDTSYANRVVLNTLQEYFKANDIDTKVHTVKGFVTSMFRKRITRTFDAQTKNLFKKDRDYFAHHAIDALLVAALKAHSQLIWVFNKANLENLVVDEETGEVMEQDTNFFNREYIEFIKHLILIDEFAKTNAKKEVDEKNLTTKYSWKIDTKANRQISDETIYSTRSINNEEFVVEKIKDIYNNKDFRLANWIINGDIDKLLIYKHSPESYKILEEIAKYYYQKYMNDKSMVSEKMKKDKTIIDFKFNPFSLYYDENQQFIRKYSKKGNGPVIKQVKYISDRLVSHIPIKQKYDVNGNNVVLLSLKPFRTDFYYSETQGKYKYIVIYHKDISCSKGEYMIDQKYYQEYLQRRGIDETYKFCFSVHRNEILFVQKNKEDIGQSYRFIGAMPNSFIFEVKNISRNNFTGERIYYTSTACYKIEKHATDVLGNEYKLENQHLKLKFK